MGLAKNEMMRREDLEAQARAVLVKAKAAEQCPGHDDVLIWQQDPEADSRAYAIGTNMVKNGEVDGTREEFMDAIKGAIEEAGFECPTCAKHRDE